MQIHVAHRDIFTAVVVLRVLDFWGEKPSIHFTSLAWFCSLLLRYSRDVAPPVWATRGGNTGTCAVPDEVRALDRVASPRPILASPRERELRQRTRYTTTRPRCDAGDRHPQQIGAFDISLSTPITTLDFVRCASPCSLQRDIGNTNAHALPPRTLAFTTGLERHHWEMGLVLFWCGIWLWDLVLVLSWSGFWVWDLVNFNARGVGLLCWRPHTLDLESFAGRDLVFKFLCWPNVD